MRKQNSALIFTVTSASGFRFRSALAAAEQVAQAMLKCAALVAEIELKVKGQERDELGQEDHPKAAVER